MYADRGQIQYHQWSGGNEFDAEGTRSGVAMRRQLLPFHLLARFRDPLGSKASATTESFDFVPHLGL